jgi:hypothetical protein
MWTPRIVINNQEVLSQGSIVSYGNQAIDFYPLPIPSNNYLVKLVFQQKAGEAATINSNSVPPSTFVITLTNCDAPTIIGNPNPIYVANHLSRRVMMTLALEYVGPAIVGTRVVHYTFFDGGPS